MNIKQMFVLLNLTESIYAIMVVILAVLFSKWWVLFGLLVVGFNSKIMMKILKLEGDAK